MTFPARSTAAHSRYRYTAMIQKGRSMSLKDTIQEKTGIYRLGFNPYSFMGILFPLLFVIIVGGALAFMVAR
jgi:hypothetical protein